MDMFLDYDEEMINDDDFSPNDDVQNDDMSTDGEDDVQDITQENPKVQTSDQNDQNDHPQAQNIPSPQNDEGLPKGYFLVETILRHKFDQGWKFLTKWQNYPMSSSTW